MSKSRIIFLSLSILIIAWSCLVRNIDEATVISIAVLSAGSMIWFPEFWTSFMRWGFIESLARDSRKPGNSSAAIVFLGWVALLIIGGGAFFL